MAEIFKPLVHVTKDGYQLPGEGGKWSSFESGINDFIRNIKTRDLNFEDEGAALIGAIVSGVPSVFARADLFRSAIDRGDGQNVGAKDMSAFYQSLLNEWKGLIACIALESENITIKRIYMKYSDGKNISETANLYEPKGAFGNMLFNRKKFWSEQEYDKYTVDDEHRGIPFVDVIKYKGAVVGGTSPESLLFTSVDYKINNVDKKPFIDSSTGKFTDPIGPSSKAQLTAEQAASLIAYIKHVEDQIQEIFIGNEENQSYFHKIKEEYSEQIRRFNKFVQILNNWRGELESFAKSKGFSINGSLSIVSCFSKSPYKDIFNRSDILYGLNGKVYLRRPKEGNATEFKPKELFISEDEAEIARLAKLAIDKNSDINKVAPAYYLKAEVKSDPTSYSLFALPLSPSGLKVFGDGLGNILLGYRFKNLKESTAGTVIEAIYDDLENNLYVIIHLKPEDRPYEETEISFTMKYNVASKAIKNKEVIVWPDFRSKKWNRYFMYSEIPHNTTSGDVPFMSVPFVGSNDKVSEIIESEDSKEIFEPQYLADDGKIIVPNNNLSGLAAKLHVRCTIDINSNPYKYEIYESNLPFKGVRLLTAARKEAGFLIMRYESNPEWEMAKNLYNDVEPEPTKVTLGIDFGSTNTSIAYNLQSEDDIESNGFILRNHRITLLPQQPSMQAKENEILFFQAKEVRSNAIKSVLTLHDIRRIVKEENDTNAILLKNDIKGGFPCFEPNLPVSGIGKNTINLSYPKGIQEVEQVNNMKWQNDDIAKSHMAAFLKSLLLQICADLYTIRYDNSNKHTEPLFPDVINWAYPAAMPESQRNDYNSDIWNSLSQKPPIEMPAIEIDGIKQPYRFKVASYGIAIYKGGIGGMSSGMGDMSGGMGGMSSGMGGMSGGMGGMSGGMSGMSGGMGDMSGGMGGMSDGTAMEQCLIPSKEPVVFNFIDLPTNGCLSEACSVANFLSSDHKINMAGDKFLTICFDIGGSTSDISAICQMKTGNDSEAIKMSMVKQSSIRFAAQQVSEATKYSKSLKDVFLQVCSEFAKENSEIKILQDQINKSYTSDTAQYYYERMVDVLDNSQLKVLYQSIRSKCPELLAVNLYVTGLIMYYAGQLTKKLVIDVRQSKENALQEKPFINIVFAGKGSRIFEWFKNTDGDYATRYYNELFLGGFGGLKEAQNLITNFGIQLPDNDRIANVKYEVSKGLALVNTNDNAKAKMRVPENNISIELIGESSFEVRDGQNCVKLEYTDSITPPLMQNIGSKFTLSREFDNNPCPNFWMFVDYFREIVSKLFNFNLTRQEVVEHCLRLNIESYIKNMPEYQTAERAENFDFVAPIVILEGMKFYKDALIKVIKERY